MNDEIKEILDDLKNIEDYLSFSEANKLLDYITNLKQENERLKKLEYKFFYCSEDEESFTLEDYLELGNKVYDLEQENERLKEKELLIESDINNAYSWLKDYKSRVEKAVEYIKDSGISFLNLANQRCFCNNQCADKILNILQGGKDE